MRSKIGAGILAGILAGLVFGLMMQMMVAPTPDGNRVPMMAMVARVVRSDNLAVGWLYHLFNSAVIGGLFGWLTRSTGSLGGALGVGALYGLAWWVLGGLVLMPAFLGMPAFAPIAAAEMRPVAVGSLVGHLIFGLFLGGAYSVLRRFGTEPRVSSRPRAV